MSTKSNETTLRAMQMTTSDTPASPLRSFFHTCRSNSNTGLLVLFGVLFLTFSLGSVREICGVAHVVSLAQRILGVMAHVR